MKWVSKTFKPELQSYWFGSSLDCSYLQIQGKLELLRSKFLGRHKNRALCQHKMTTYNLKVDIDSLTENYNYKLYGRQCAMRLRSTLINVDTKILSYNFDIA
jgi:hypothetical protein